MRKARTLWSQGQLGAYLFVRARRPPNLLQPTCDTAMDRYPAIFAFARRELADHAGLRLLSFGCATGEEAFTLRGYFPSAWIHGIDANRLNVARARRRRRRVGDERMSFTAADSVAAEQDGAYDAVFCMAVLRHGELNRPEVQSCEHRLPFAVFDRAVAELGRKVRDGGLLVIQYSQFRFCDAAAFRDFEPVFQVDNGSIDPPVPLFGPDNRRLLVRSYDDVVFRKRRLSGG